MVITWERWEGTIEHTLMAPVARSLHLVGMSLFGVLHAVVRTLLILLLVLPFFSVEFGQANLVAAVAVVALGSVSIVGIAILGGVLPLLYPERGTQMTFMMQAVILLVSGVYYSVDVLPGWLRFFSHVSPATYMLDGIRGALIDGKSIGEMMGTLLTLAGFGALLVPSSILVFRLGERWARKAGKLKRQG
jgi:ABC-2 type transport system permease protein